MMIDENARLAVAVDRVATYGGFVAQLLPGKHETWVLGASEEGPKLPAHLARLLLENKLITSHAKLNKRRNVYRLTQDAINLVASI